MNPGCDLSSSLKAISFAETYPYFYAAVGFHPEFAGKMTQKDLESVASLAGHPKVMAIGEIGLDYHYDDACPREIQREVLPSSLLWQRSFPSLSLSTTGRPTGIPWICCGNTGRRALSTATAAAQRWWKKL